MAARNKSGKHNGEEILIPDKLYFRIGEVATLCRLPAYVLRFWESEFPQLRPVKSSTGQRINSCFTNKDSRFQARVSTCARKSRPTSRSLRFRFPLNQPQKFSIFGRGCERFWICYRRAERARNAPFSAIDLKVVASSYWILRIALLRCHASK